MTSFLPMKNLATHVASVAKSPRDKQCKLFDSASDQDLFLYQTHLFISEKSINSYLHIQGTISMSLQNQDKSGKSFKKNLQINNKHALFFVLFSTLPCTWYLYKLNYTVHSTSIHV